MKKVKFLIIACLSIAILSYGVIAFANSGASADSKKLLHGDVAGKFVALVEGNSKIKLNLENGVETYPLDRSIWVFRDQKKTALENLKTGDKIELILNSSKKVVYIKAFSEVYLKTSAASFSASPTATVTAEPTPTVTPNENIRIMLVKEDHQVVIKKKHKKEKHRNDHGDNHSDDTDGNDDDHHDRKKHDHDGKED